MILISLADACRQLGVDAKTLRRWLSDAQLPLHTYPADSRKKGVSQAQLERLAHQHQRRLLALREQPSAPAPPSEPPPLPAELLVLPERLAALQAQVDTLQQQIAELTHLLRQPAHPLAQPDAPVSRLAQPVPAAPHSHPAAPAKTPSKPTHVIPRVEYSGEGNYVVICPKRGLLPFEPETPEWFRWVAKQDSFRFVGKSGHFTAHHEWRVPKGAWRAHRKIRNHTHIVRLAPNQDLTIAVLEQAAAALQAHLLAR